MLLLISCDNRQTNEEADQAFTNYKEFVTTAEMDADTEYSETELRAMRKSVQDSTLWQTESAELMQQYEDREKKVRDNFSSYDEARQAEIEDLDTRYNAAVAKRENKYKEASRRYKLREEILGLPISADDMSAITAEELAPTYHRFVENLERRATNLNKADWDLVEGWWVTLNNRKRTLEAQLSTESKGTIQQATDKYLDIRKKSSIPA
ncbi:phosphopantetheine adenylyltransferase [Pontibacter aydingkolensis]|uniref:Uncharacterized protein n=1 Tax=Pontibacter aydingkolensis TaxID=1911536 RepID=A0ABS7CVT3_9BACT|nr:hypothetical protein [Pontibacter aydingkolensis]MBW7467878.1 hypothetical protein [Pontibacter aydingkolensis]